MDRDGNRESGMDECKSRAPALELKIEVRWRERDRSAQVYHVCVIMSALFDAPLPLFLAASIFYSFILAENPYSYFNLYDENWLAAVGDIYWQNSIYINLAQQIPKGGEDEKEKIALSKKPFKAALSLFIFIFAAAKSFPRIFSPRARRRL